MTLPFLHRIKRIPRAVAGRVPLLKRYVAKEVDIRELANPGFLKKNINRKFRFVAKTSFFFKSKKNPIVPKQLKPVQVGMPSIVAVGSVREVYRFNPLIISRLVHNGKELKNIDIHLFPLVVLGTNLDSKEISSHLIEQFSHLKNRGFTGIIKRSAQGKFHIVTTEAVELEGITAVAFKQEALGG